MAVTPWLAQASAAIERLSLMAEPPACDATCAELLASKARRAAELLHLTLGALLSAAEARDAREVTFQPPAILVAHFSPRDMLDSVEFTPLIKDCNAPTGIFSDDRNRRHFVVLSGLSTCARVQGSKVP